MPKTAREVIADVERDSEESAEFCVGGVLALNILDALDAAGFVIVPKEPTEAMLETCHDHRFHQYGGDSAYLTQDDLEDNWRIMIAAAKVPP